MSVASKQEILSLLDTHRDSIRDLGVRGLGLFGSFVREQPGRDSDVDLLVEFAPGQKSFDNFMGLSFLLEKLFGRDIELVTYEALSPYLGPHILAEVEYVPFAP